MIAHLDADAFFASVLQRKHPHLKGKPLLAAGMGGGCVIAASYEAKAKGVKTGMPVWEAIKLCPEAIRMPADFRETGIASKQIESMLQNVCPIIEQYSIDEWFLDLRSCVGGIPTQLEQWAAELQKSIGSKTDLSVSIGIGPTKLLAKMASEYRKPAGITVVRRDVRIARLYGMDIKTFLQDRPTPAIPGIGRQREKHTAAHGWATAWDFANANQAEVKKLFGKNGPELQRELLGECVSEVTCDVAPPKSVSRTRAFKATANRELLWAHILHHVQYIVLKMRKHGLRCHGVSVWVRDRDYHHAGSTKRLPQALDTEESLLPYLRTCFEECYQPGKGYNQAGACLWGLTGGDAHQLTLFQSANESIKDEHLQHALDVIRHRFGREVITRGQALSVMEEHRPELEISVYET